MNDQANNSDNKDTAGDDTKEKVDEPGDAKTDADTDENEDEHEFDDDSLNVHTRCSGCQEPFDSNLDLMNTPDYYFVIRGGRRYRCYNHYLPYTCKSCFDCTRCFQCLVGPHDDLCPKCQKPFGLDSSKPNQNLCVLLQEWKEHQQARQYTVGMEIRKKSEANWHKGTIQEIHDEFIYTVVYTDGTDQDYEEDKMATTVTILTDNYDKNDNNKRSNSISGSISDDGDTAAKRRSKRSRRSTAAAAAVASLTPKKQTGNNKTKASATKSSATKTTASNSGNMPGAKETSKKAKASSGDKNDGAKEKKPNAAPKDGSSGSHNKVSARPQPKQPNTASSTLGRDETKSNASSDDNEERTPPQKQRVDVGGTPNSSSSSSSSKPRSASPKPTTDWKARVEEMRVKHKLYEKYPDYYSRKNSSHKLKRQEPQQSPLSEQQQTTTRPSSKLPPSSPISTSPSKRTPPTLTPLPLSPTRPDWEAKLDEVIQYRRDLPISLPDTLQVMDHLFFGKGSRRVTDRLLDSTTRRYLFQAYERKHPLVRWRTGIQWAPPDKKSLRDFVELLWDYYNVRGKEQERKGT